MADSRWKNRLNIIMHKHHKSQESLKLKNFDKIYGKLNTVTGKPKINEVSKKIVLELNKLEFETEGTEQQQPIKKIPESNTQQKHNNLPNNPKIKPRTQNSPKTEIKPVVIPKDKIGNLIETYVKAQCLHSRQQTAQPFTTHMHVNLATCQASPLYINSRAPKCAKIKTSNGFANSETLKRGFLCNDSLSDQEEESMYTKNINWVKEKQERLNKKRDHRKSEDLESCTFRPKIDRLNLNGTPLGYCMVNMNYK